MTGVTSGGQAGTSGRIARWERVVILGIAAMTLANNLVNVLSAASDRAEAGLPDLGWELWLWELSSWLGMLAMLPFALRAARAFRPPRLPWAAIPLAHLPVSMVFSAGHVAIMLAIRQTVYASVGRTYDYFGGSPAAVFLYEYRKDLIGYAIGVSILLLVRALAEAQTGSPTSSPQSKRIEVKDGGRTVWLAPEEIVSAEAAGNYVELVTPAGKLLHRATFASMEAKLVGHGFVRIHRSRLVRRAAVREVRATASGDFELLLTDGRTIAGSRRYRDRLDGGA